MRTRDARVNGWAQSALLPPENLRIEVTIHMAVGSDVVQVGIHCSDHVNDTVLGIHVSKVPMSPDSGPVLDLVSDLVEAAISEHWYPF